MEEKEEQLLYAATELFMRLGVKSFTMDDISGHLGISKKTLYQFVSDKKDLVKKAVQLAINNDERLLIDLTAQKENAIDELLAINEKMSDKLQRVQPAVMYDLKRYYPEAWKIMEDHKKRFVYDIVVKNINVGIKQGLYRENVHPGIIAKVYINLIDKIFDVNTFPTHQYTFATIHKEIARYHIRGIASEKGVNYLVKRLKNNNHDF